MTLHAEAMLPPDELRPPPHVMAALAGGGELKAPFPAFGGKSRIAAVVWKRLGVDVRNYVEPFAFSSAVLLRRPGGAGAVETINDRNAYVSNFWRAVQADPDAVARHIDWPVNEVDLHARHKWLVNSDAARAALDRVREDPTYYDVVIAGYWGWGLCSWIGAGWCDETSDRVNTVDSMHVELLAERGVAAKGPSEQVIDLSGVGGAHGRGVNASAGPGKKRVKLTGNGVGCGVHANPSDPGPDAFGGAGGGGNADAPASADVNPRHPGLSQDVWGIHAGGGIGENNRPQLADAYARGRGVNGNDHLSTCEARHRWIRAWMHRLADRLRPVRVCCGHWARVCDSDSTMTRLGTTGVFLDPPYAISIARVRAWLRHLRGEGPPPAMDEAGAKNRTRHIYANDRVQDVDFLVAEVTLWCLKWGPNRDVRIALCGLEGEYPDLEAAGWEVFAWKSNGGYGNQRGGKNANAARERVWFSPHCLKDHEEAGLFAGVGA